MKRSREVEGERDTQCVAADGHLANTSTQPTSNLPTKKAAQLDPTDVVLEDEAGIGMRCSLPGHTETLSFKTYDEYQSHYYKAHTNRCLECRNNFPSSHLLGVHIEECHDAFVAVKRDKGEHTVSPRD